MTRMQYAVVGIESGNASGKAKKDALRIASDMGFSLSYHPASVRLVRVLQQILSMPRFLGKRIIFFQYPAVSNEMFGLFKRMVSKDSIIIALVHDLLSVRGYEAVTPRKEVETLNCFDFLIVHNRSMETCVRDWGYSGTTITLNLFDYLHDPARALSEPFHDGSVTFAGNLLKAGFVRDLDKIASRRFLLYGNANPADFQSMKNVEYKGLLPSDEIPYLMEGDYGLVWDGDSIDSCVGSYGAYLRYNNPHKLSLCVAAGKPVITWSRTAIADFVKEYKIGITVNSLSELDNIDLTRDYDRMRLNVLELKQKVATGFFLKRALTQSLSEIES